MMCVPLVGRSNTTPFGVIQLDTQDRFKQFTQDDLKLLLAVAGQAAVALENADMHITIVKRAGLERDLQLARDVQKSFLPSKMPQVSGYEFWARYESAQEVGGDYYDFVPLPGGRHGIMVGDVAGKGIPAALLMAKVSSDARFCALTQPGISDMMSELNEHLQEAGRLDRFVTFGAGLLDPATHAIDFANAGHCAPLIYRGGHFLRSNRPAARHPRRHSLRFQHGRTGEWRLRGAHDRRGHRVQEQGRERPETGGNPRSPSRRPHDSASHG